MPEQDLLVGYRGVKFDATGQNDEGARDITQLDGPDYTTVWPQDAAGGVAVAVEDLRPADEGLPSR